MQQLDFACAVAAVAVRRIAVIATFIRFDDAIATSRSNTGIRCRQDIAHIGHGTIGILIASTRAGIRIAETARANHIGHAGLSEFLEAHRIATVAGHRIAVVATFTHIDHVVAASRHDADIRVWPRCTYLPHCAIGVRIASTDIARWIAIPAGARRAHARTRAPEFKETNAVATVAIRAIAVITTFRGTLLTIATNRTAKRSASNRIREDRIQRAAPTAPRRRSRAIGTDIRPVIGRTAIVVCRIGRVEPRHQRWREFDRPIHEVIVVNIPIVAKCPRGDSNDLGVTYGHRQWSADRRNRGHIRSISRTVRRRSHRILVEIDSVRIVDAIDDRRILVRRQITVRIDETTPPKGTDVRRILERIDVETQPEVEVRRVGCDVQRRMHCVANHIASTRCITFDIAKR